MRWRRVAVWLFVGAVVAGVGIDLLVRTHRLNSTLLTFQGAVIRKDDDPRRQLPIAGVVVTATRGEDSVSVQTDSSGFFRLTFPQVIWPGQTVSFAFRHDGYVPAQLDMHLQFRSMAKQLMVMELKPEGPAAEPNAESANASKTPPITVSNIRIRYTENNQREENIGSAVNTFQVKNQGNIPCKNQSPCSPDGLWKATTDSATMDAGAGNEFRNVRASCIAGPCPFTHIDTSGFEHGGRVIKVSATDWSNTATFLFEAEVFRTSIGSSVRQSYPVIFGRTLNFTLPPTQEGVSIEADVNGEPMVFPLGPALYLSWANCNARSSSDQEKSTVYRCELKPGYRF